MYSNVVLYSNFVHAVQLLGGHEIATPKSVLVMMNDKDRTLTHVKCHLQVYGSSSSSSIQISHFFSCNTKKESISF
ncbi:Probable transcription factor KAN4 [Linum perenne]